MPYPTRTLNPEPLFVSMQPTQKVEPLFVNMGFGEQKSLSESNLNKPIIARINPKDSMMPDDWNKKRIEATVYAETGNSEDEIRKIVGVISNRHRAYEGRESLFDVVATPGQFKAFVNQSKDMGEDNPLYANYLNDIDIDKKRQVLVKKAVNELLAGTFKSPTKDLFYKHSGPARARVLTTSPTDNGQKGFPYRDKGKNPANQ